MQNNTVKAFRQRLIRAGFKVKYIYHYRGDLYDICVIDSDYNIIKRKLSLIEMDCIPRVVWFD